MYMSEEWTEQKENMVEILSSNEGHAVTVICVYMSAAVQNK